MDLQRKIGPLPLWAWIGIAAVIGYVVYEKRKQSAAAAAVPATVSPDLSSQLSGIGTAATPAGSTAGYSSLGDWQSAAASGAIGAGYNPSDTETALANYASGQPLSTSQEGILNWILQKFGSPPGGATPVIAGALPPPQAQPGSSESATTGYSGSSFAGAGTSSLSGAGGGAPAPTNFGDLSGYTYVPTIADLGVLRAEGQTIYGDVAGQPVAVLQGQTPTAAFAAYQKTAGGNPRFYVKAS